MLPKNVEKGRIYAKVAEKGPISGEKRAFAKATATLEIKITRADGSIEYRNVPATVEEAD